MADEQKRFFVRREMPLEPDHRVHIEMVRRFVEQKNIRLPRQKPRQSEPCPLTAAHLFDRHGVKFFGEAEADEEAAAARFEMKPAVRRETRVQRGEFRAQPRQAVAGGRRKRAFDLRKPRLHMAKLGKRGVHLPENGVVDRRIRLTGEDVERVVLLQHSDRLVLRDIDRALARRVFAGDHAHERGFSAAVDADDREPVAFLERKGDVR